MTTVNDIGYEALKMALKNVVSTDITYQRGNSTLTIPATRGSVSWNTIVNGQKGVSVSKTHREYIVDSEDMTLIPTVRDIIVDGTDHCEVYAVDGATYRYCGPGKQIMRIYTRVIQ